MIFSLSVSVIVLFCLFYWNCSQCSFHLAVLVVYVLLFTLASLYLCIVCIVIVLQLLFCWLYSGCSKCAFPLAALVVFMLLFAIAGAQWLMASVDCTTACSAAAVVEASKVRFLSHMKFYKVSKLKMVLAQRSN